ncbi:hypothetical protein J3D45_002933 [Microbacterium foliorum]|uniref:hypothetical protein n=1 Tax=Microbacterium foliorum TaxID=104336 RepID=UPI0020A00295|nr:hypothetical protein [Microbacterium foliorum]MCP1430435.1 hypothetical protein [Microbacterium foliorum]
MTINLWGTPIDPKTGLPVYPVNGPTKSTAGRLLKQAKDAGAVADRLQEMLDEATAEFEKSFIEADRHDATRRRIAEMAKTRTI